jgi:predicted peptidase
MLSVGKLTATPLSESASGIQWHYGHDLFASKTISLRTSLMTPICVAVWQLHISRIAAFLLCFTITAVSLVSTTFAQAPIEGQISTVLKNSITGANLGYRIFVPSGCATNPGTKRAVVMFLHGAGEMGEGASVSELAKVDAWGPIAELTKTTSTFKTIQTTQQAIVVHPQYSGSNGGFYNGTIFETFRLHLLALYPCADATRVYLMGFSRGGYNTLTYLGRFADKIAAAAPINPQGYELIAPDLGSPFNPDTAANAAQRAALASTAVWTLVELNDFTNSQARTTVSSIACLLNKTVCDGNTRPVPAAQDPDTSDTSGNSHERTLSYDVAARAWTQQRFNQLPSLANDVAAPTTRLGYTRWIRFNSNSAHNTTSTMNSAAFWNWLFAQQRVSGGVALSGSAMLSSGGNVADGTVLCANPATGVSCGTTSGGNYSCSVPSGWSGTLHLQAGNSNRVTAKRYASGITTAQTAQNYVVSPAISFPCNLDIDNNGLYEAGIDGLMVMRKLFGYTGAAQLVGTAGVCSQRTNPADTIAFLNSQNYNLNGSNVSSQQEGLILLRLMLGIPGAQAVAATGLTWNEVQSSINTTCGTNF